MTKYTWPPRCDECGKFMSLDDLGGAVYWTPYGHAYDQEPPDERIMHKACWDELSDYRKGVVERSAWLKPKAWTR